MKNHENNSEKKEFFLYEKFSLRGGLYLKNQRVWNAC